MNIVFDELLQNTKCIRTALDENNFYPPIATIAHGHIMKTTPEHDEWFIAGDFNTYYCRPYKTQSSMHVTDLCKRKDLNNTIYKLNKYIRISYRQYNLIEQLSNKLEEVSNKLTEEMLRPPEMGGSEYDRCFKHYETIRPH